MLPKHLLFCKMLCKMNQQRCSYLKTINICNVIDRNDASWYMEA